MAGTDPTTFGALLVAVAFLPPLLWVVLVRNAERYRREPWGALMVAFLFGGLVSVVVALGLTGLVAHQFGLLQREYLIIGEERFDVNLSQGLILVVIAAPVVEEFAKGLGVVWARRRIHELEDGIIYGAAAGLGFSATENLLYELNAVLTDGATQLEALALGVLRSITSSLLHATASGIVGYGLARRYVLHGQFIEVLPYYALAVLVHAMFNLTAVLLSETWAIGLIVFFSFIGIRWTLGRIRKLDLAGAPTT